ncbi:DUF4174 domain-containing protein [Pseudaestuariivita sp.]|uniref:DUF4174 domain-containing protein n=1 Tax=Pseudaestuariivita sp. TaxID=2211669 RepID=UPI004059A9C9
MQRITTLALMATLAAPALAQDTASPAGTSSATGTASSAGVETPETPVEEAAMTDAPLIRDGAEVDLSEFRWTARPIVVFADSPADPAFQRQIALLTAREYELRERDVIVFTDTDPDGESALRTQLRPRGFMLALIGKDGGVKLRKPLPWDVREISRVIDKMPQRQQEIRDRRASGS